MRRKTKKLIRRSKRRRREKFDAYESYWKLKMGWMGGQRRREQVEELEKRQAEVVRKILERRKAEKEMVTGSWKREKEGNEKGEREAILNRIESENTILKVRIGENGEEGETRGAEDKERGGEGEQEMNEESRDTRRERREVSNQVGGGGEDLWAKMRRTQAGGGGGRGGSVEPARVWRPEDPQDGIRVGHRSQLQNIEVELKPSIGDVVEATSREPTFAWGGNATVQGIKKLDLYTSDNETVVFPCYSLGPAGYYSVRLIAPGLATESARLIVSSLWFKVCIRVFYLLIY